MKLICFTLLFFTTALYADNVYYCANTNQGISVGESLQQVFTACGAPNTANASEQLVPITSTAQQWVYTRGISSITAQGIVPAPNSPTVIFTLENGVVTQVQRSGGVMLGNVGCDVVQSLGINSSAAAVRLTCGNPTYIQAVPQANSIQHTITTWTYNHGPFQPQIIFTFTDGFLTNIKSGQLGT